MKRGVASVLLVLGCDRARSEKHEPSPAIPPTAVDTTRTDSPCDAPFPPARLAELARDSKVVEPWGHKRVDETNRVVTLEPSTGEPGDPIRIAAAWKLPLPVAYADSLRRFDGANVRAVGNRPVTDVLT